MRGMKVKVRQVDEEPVSTEVLATAIARIADGFAKLTSSGLNRRALLVLVSASSGVNRRTVEVVLTAIEGLKAEYCKKTR